MALLTDYEAETLGECLGLIAPASNMVPALSTSAVNTATPTTPGAVSTSTAPPDPNNPGYLMDGTPDPNYAGAAGGATGGGLDPTTGIVTDMNGNVFYDPTNDQPVLPTVVVHFHRATHRLCGRTCRTTAWCTRWLE